MLQKIDEDIIWQVLVLTEEQYHTFLKRLEPSQMEYLAYIFDKKAKEWE